MGSQASSLRQREGLKVIGWKSLHSLIWVVMVTSIGQLTLAGVGVRNVWSVETAVAGALITGEIVTLACFDWICPITLVVRNLVQETDWKNRRNFDIFLPELVAKYNKEIFTPPLLIGLTGVMFQLVSGQSFYTSSSV